MITCTKKYVNLPAAHRQHNHPGHCSLIHGHDWSFEFTFACKELTAEGFVVDFGKLGWLKAMLNDMFDHTLLLNEDDPKLEYFQSTLGKEGLAKIIIVPNCGAEGLAEYMCLEAGRFISHDHSGKADHDRGLHVVKVTCFEDSKNSASYYAI